MSSFGRSRIAPARTGRGSRSDRRARGRYLRVVYGRAIYFCCESCANYFSANRERVVVARGFPTPAGTTP